MAVSIDLDFLSRFYFCFDEPVPYMTKTGEVKIKPVSLRDSEVFLYSTSVLTIDKNSISNVDIIQMSYLQFICKVLLENGDTKSFYERCLYNILNLCLGYQRPYIKWKSEKSPVICEEGSGVEINAKEFDEIKSIIMHQNLPNYDDKYINPDLKKAMAEQDELKNKDKESPSLERKMAIITSHTGLPKREQELMTFRSHSLLFEEVVGEVEFSTTRPPLIARGLVKDLDHWIFKKVKNKFDGYTKSIDSYTKSMGGSGNIRSSNAETGVGDSYIQQFNNFDKK